jgi:Uma2 family endonuclease
MATESKQPRAGHRLYRLTVPQFLSMIEIGVFPEGPRVELLGGVLIAQTIKTDPHDFAVDLIGEKLRGIVPGDRIVREEKALTLGPYSRATPDLAVVRGPRSLYGGRAPTAEESALIVEVAEPKEALARGLRWRLHASARIPVYWIVNLGDRRIEVYRDPAGRGRSASYRQADTFGPEAEVPVVIDGREVGRLAVAEILP